MIAQMGGKSSRNRLKSKEHLFATFRDCNLEETYNKVASKYKVVASIAEEVVYDTNPDVDSGWICECPLKNRVFHGQNNQ